MIIILQKKTQNYFSLPQSIKKPKKIRFAILHILNEYVHRKSNLAYTSKIYI